MVRYPLKTPWKNGTTHVEFEPNEFIAKLAALVPPRAHPRRTPPHIVASVEEPQTIRAILDHFENNGVLSQAHYRPRPRAQPAVAGSAHPPVRRAVISRTPIV